MRNPTTRAKYSRVGLRYETDLTDAEWRVLEPLLPPPCRCGRRRRWPARDIVNAIAYVLRSGCNWRMLPKDFPPVSTVYRWFATWRDGGMWRKVNDTLVQLDRHRVGHTAEPTAAVLDGTVQSLGVGAPSAFLRTI